MDRYHRNQSNRYRGYKYKAYVWRTDEKDLTASALKYKRRLNRSKHWYSGMVLESTGRGRLHHDLKVLARTYSAKTSTNQWEKMTEKVQEPYDSWDYRY